MIDGAGPGVDASPPGAVPIAAAGVPPPDPAQDLAIESLRQILVGPERSVVTDLTARVDTIESRLGDDTALMDAIAPLMQAAIGRQIREAREEMVEALYPIIGALIGRAVAEAMRDLARQVDARMRGGLNPRLAWWRLRARLGGAPGDATVLRAMLPFEVEDVLLIHRATGLLLHHVTRRPRGSGGIDGDADVVSGMLTAIRDFAATTLPGQAGDELEEIQHGQQRILLEGGRLAYLAVIVDGIEPPELRPAMRDRLAQIERRFRATLEDYEGDATVLAPAGPLLGEMLVIGQPRPLGRAQKLLLAGIGAAGLAVVVGAVLVAGWLWRAWRAPAATAPPTAAPPVVMATSVPTPRSTPMAGATPAPSEGVMAGNAWIRRAPSTAEAAFGVAVRGTRVWVLGAEGDWLRVRAVLPDGSAVEGWMADGPWIQRAAAAEARDSATPTPKTGG